MAVEVDVKKSDIPMSPVKKGHTTVWHLQKMKDEGKKISMVGTAYLDPVFTMMCEKAGVDLVRYTAPGENSEMRAQNIHWWTRMQKKMAPNICLNAVMQTQQYPDKTIAVQEAARLLADGADCVMPMGVTNSYSWIHMYITSITGDLRLPWDIKAQFSTRPNWASDVMAFLAVYFFLTNAALKWTHSCKLHSYGGFERDAFSFSERSFRKYSIESEQIAGIFRSSAL